MPKDVFNVDFDELPEVEMDAEEAKALLQSLEKSAQLLLDTLQEMKAEGTDVSDIDEVIDRMRSKEQPSRVQH